jgi:hypothetical protein
MAEASPSSRSEKLAPAETWRRLRVEYERQGVVLALGAGVSKDSGLPNWPELLERVASSFGGDTEEVVRALRADRTPTPLPVIASILEERSGSRDKFVERVRKALYCDFPFFPEGIVGSNRAKLIGHVETRNATLNTVASLCVTRAGRENRYFGNPRIRAIVNFNLDGVLKEYIDVRYGKGLLRTVERASAQTIPGRLITVYQMHGLLRFDRKAGNPKKEAREVVLTEQNYFDFFNNPTSLFNYTFLYLLRESPCLFIGLSMEDENIRRMLHYSKKERMDAFDKEGVPKVEARRRSIRHFAIVQRRTPQIDQAIEESLLPLGTRVLWVGDHKEIPARLGKMYAASGDDWRLVYETRDRLDGSS